jgi:hypothetical protein
MKPFAKIWPHAFLWLSMLLYFIFAPDVFTYAFVKHGKPLRVDAAVPAESERIHFVIEDLHPYVKDGEHLHELIGWSLILPEEGMSADLFVPEVALVSGERKYFFSAETVYRKPKIPDKFADIDINYDTLGLSVLIAENAIKPGKYRIGVVFRNPSDGSAFYRDKPVYYLVRTPNTLRLEEK